MGVCQVSAEGVRQVLGEGVIAVGVCQVLGEGVIAVGVCQVSVEGVRKVVGVCQVSVEGVIAVGVRHCCGSMPGIGGGGHWCRSICQVLGGRLQ